MKYCFVFFLLGQLSLYHLSHAQSELPASDITDEAIQFNIGLFLSFDDFIKNNAVEFENVDGDLEKFLENPMSSHVLSITRNDSTFQCEFADIWGYTDGKSVFLNRKLFKGIILNMVTIEFKVTPWVKIQVIETLCYVPYFSTRETHDRYQSKKKTTQSEFILDTRDGKFYDADLKELKLLIKDDPELLAELERSKEDKEFKFYSFLKKYNRRHPFKFK